MYEGHSINKLQNGAIPSVLKIGKIRNIRFVANLILNIHTTFLDDDVIIVTSSGNRTQSICVLFSPSNEPRTYTCTICMLSQVNMPDSIIAICRYIHRRSGCSYVYYCARMTHSSFFSFLLYSEFYPVTPSVVGTSCVLSVAFCGHNV